LEAAVVLGHGIALGHPFVDGNRRVAHAALETMLALNGLELEAGVDLLEQPFLSLASGALSREDLTKRIAGLVVRRSS
ncbi:MAG: Fic family protein, partial [Planctomycetota bacterium]